MAEPYFTDVQTTFSVVFKILEFHLYLTNPWMLLGWGRDGTPLATHPLLGGGGVGGRV